MPEKTEASAYRKTESVFFVHEKDQIPRRKILILVDRAFSISVKAYLKPVTRWTRKKKGFIFYLDKLNFSDAHNIEHCSSYVRQARR